MNRTTNDQLSTFLGTLRTDLLNAMQARGVNTTQTARQVTIEQNSDQFQLQIPGYLQVLERGRGPTSKNAVAGNPPMITRIQQWCTENGIPAKAAWAIKKKIDKMGYPGRPGILTGPLGDDNINRRLNETMQKIADDITQQIINNLNI